MKTTVTKIKAIEAVISSAVRERFANKTFTEIKRTGNRAVQSLNTKFFTELAELGAEIVLIYREDAQFQRSWSAADYFNPPIELMLIEGSNLETRKCSARAFERAATYTAECNIFVAIVNTGDGLYDRLGSLKKFKMRMKRNLLPAFTPTHSTNENWKKYLKAQISALVPASAPQIIKRLDSDAGYLSSIFSPQNFSKQAVLNKFSA